MPPLVVFEENRAYVIEKFHNGHFDYIEVIQEVAQRDFFLYISNNGMLGELAESYPWPRKRQEVPCWLYLSADMAMRLHGNHAFHGFPWVVSTGGLLSAFGPTLGTRHRDPETGQLRIECQGFNDRNEFPRATPCDQDFLRKIARDTGSDEQLRWFNGPVQQAFRKHRFFDKEGLFIGDGSYLFVPDNDKYEGSARMLFDESNHPISTKELAALSPARAARCQWRRCYKLVSLLHTDRTGSFFLYAGLAVVPGNASECPVLWRMVDAFVAAVGQGVMRQLILDRGFIDGAAIGKAKREYGIDTTIGVRRNMCIYQDAVGLCGLADAEWHAHAPHEVDPTRKSPRGELLDPSRAIPLRLREAKRQQTIAAKRLAQGLPPRPAKAVLSWAAKIPRTTSFDSCPVPLDIVLCTTDKNPLADDAWAIMTTAEDPDTGSVLARYALRTTIEERHRHIKLFWDIADFTSCNLSLIVNQVLFTLLTYSLLQMQLFRRGQKALNKATKPRQMEKLTPVAEDITIFTDQYYARFTTYDYTELVLSVPEAVKPRLQAKLKTRQRERLYAARAPAPP
jgi:hypothetical protein